MPGRKLGLGPSPVIFGEPGNSKGL